MKKPWYDNEYYQWKEYSDFCPWRLGEVCKATTMTCDYTKCAPWYFLKMYKKQIHIEWDPLRHCISDKITPPIHLEVIEDLRTEEEE